MIYQRLALYNCSYPLNSLFRNSSIRVIPDRFNGLENNVNKLIGSCNGFLCLYDPDQNNMIMYNPSIGLKSKSSPKLKPSPDWVLVCSGFGYDHVNDKYKVLAGLVCNFDGVDFRESLTVIYTFGEDSWRTIQDLPNGICDYFYRRSGKYVSGTLNWIGHDRRGDDHASITSFDLDNETYRDVLLPQNVGYSYYMCRPSLCVLNDNLCLCYVNRTHLVVWLMKEYGVVESWTKLMNFPCEKLINLNYIHQPSIIELLFVSENDVALLMVSSQLFLYNLNNGVLSLPFTSIDNVYAPQIYRENLISPRL
ncbi:hypothetical protein TSUD_397310 [Trifolium subterraneum]|uniref:F-box associated beta-propeller type 1 domain-containing protein n=1 Tax=Trifolium subterraneum TaxID=3900 RepID=A0A2Z6N5P3_TRISU|nr:hypothetical protein TSUD_397310 [Trifolium subterraneum]